MRRRPVRRRTPHRVHPRTAAPRRLTSNDARTDTDRGDRARGGARGRSPSGDAARAGGATARRRLTPYLFLLVPLALLIVFTYIPVVNMFWYSLTDWNGLEPDQELRRAGQLRRVLHPARAVRRASWSACTTSAASVVQIALALYFATVLSFNTRFKNLFKGILFFPYLINGVAIAFDLPVLLPARRHAGRGAAACSASASTPQWLGDPDIVNFSLAGTSVWRYLGLNFVLFLGAIQSIPAQLYEAAELDGANRWQQFRYIIAAGHQAHHRPVVHPRDLRARCRSSRSRSS